MTSFPILDLVLGMIFIYFLLSVISNAIIELFMTASRARAKVLEEWLRSVFEGKSQVANNMANNIMNHPAVAALSKDNQSPSYIKASNFVTALIDGIHKSTGVAAQAGMALQSIETSIAANTTLTPELKSMLLLYITEARDAYNAMTTKTQSEIELFRQKIENWYDSSMERLTGTIKKKYARTFTFWVALYVTLGMNADSISICKYLYSNPEAQAKVAAQALSATNDQQNKTLMDNIRAHTAPADIQTVQELEQQLHERYAQASAAYAAVKTSIPIGWSKSEFESIKNGYDWTYFLLSKIAGLAATVFAILLGAPFWFDLLNTIGNLRGSGAKPIAGDGK